MNELVLPSVQVDVVGYAHNFYQNVEVDGQSVDRLVLVQQYGILSPAEARRRGVPFKTNVNILMSGVDDYEDIIFLFPVFRRDSVPQWDGARTVLVDPQLPVYSPSAMVNRYGHWVQMSHIYGGEYYTFGCVPPDRIYKFIKIL